MWCFTGNQKKQTVKMSLFFIRKYPVVLFHLPYYLNFTCCFIGLLDVTDFLQAMSVAAFVSHWLFLSLFYGWFWFMMFGSRFCDQRF